MKSVEPHWNRKISSSTWFRQFHLPKSTVHIFIDPVTAALNLTFCSSVAFFSHRCCYYHRPRICLHRPGCAHWGYCHYLGAYWFYCWFKAFWRYRSVLYIYLSGSTVLQDWNDLPRFKLRAEILMLEVLEAWITKLGSWEGDIAKE